MMLKILTYKELSELSTFEERLKYLMLYGSVGARTFGADRWVNQRFYQQSAEWKQLRNHIIVRDNGCDLGILGREIYDKIIIHHMNPIQISDIRHGTDFLVDPNYLICVSHKTHNAIHYGNESALLDTTYAERKPYDTVPWKRGNNT